MSAIKLETSSRIGGGLAVIFDMSSIIGKGNGILFLRIGSNKEFGSRLISCTVKEGLIETKFEMVAWHSWGISKVPSPCIVCCSLFVLYGQLINKVVTLFVL